MALFPSVRASALCLSLLTPFAVPIMAQAQIGGMIFGSDIDRIAELASAYGPAERRFDNIEDGPWIRAEMGDVVYTIGFFNCDNGENCSSIQLRAFWESEGAHSLERMNQWNIENRFGAAYLDSDNNATIEFDVNLAGGVTAVNFDDTLQWWQLVLSEFVANVINPGFAAVTGQGTPAPLQSK